MCSARRLWHKLKARVVLRQSPLAALQVKLHVRMSFGYFSLFPYDVSLPSSSCCAKTTLRKSTSCHPAQPLHTAFCLNPCSSHFSSYYFVLFASFKGDPWICRGQGLHFVVAVRTCGSRDATCSNRCGQSVAQWEVLVPPKQRPRDLSCWVNSFWTGFESPSEIRFATICDALDRAGEVHWTRMRNYLKYLGLKGRS